MKPGDAQDLEYLGRMIAVVTEGADGLRSTVAVLEKIGGMLAESLPLVAEHGVGAMADCFARMTLLDSAASLLDSLLEMEGKTVEHVIAEIKRDRADRRFDATFGKS